MTSANRNGNSNRIGFGFGIRLGLGLGLLILSSVALAEAPTLPPRWRVRGEVAEGFGGSLMGGRLLAVFPTRLTVDFQLWKNVSFEVGGAAMVSGSPGICDKRPTSGWLNLGLRYDFGNARGGRWVVPFVETHTGFTAQRIGESCGSPKLAATFGGRFGLDVWLGHAAVTVGVAFDYLPVASPLYFTLGVAFVGL